MIFMIINQKKTLFLGTFCFILGALFLGFYDISPVNKSISEINDGDFVKIFGKIQKLDVKYNEYHEVTDIKSVKLMDETAGDLLLYINPEISNEFLKYVLNENPRIKEGDIVEVTGKIAVYNGLYELILTDMNDFKLVEKVNFESDIIFSRTETSIYASKNSDKYHVLKDCPYGSKITEKIYFKTEEDAKNLEYTKCSYCEDRD